MQQSNGKDVEVHDVDARRKNYSFSIGKPIGQITVFRRQHALLAVIKIRASVKCSRRIPAIIKMETAIVDAIVSILLCDLAEPELSNICAGPFECFASSWR